MDFFPNTEAFLYGMWSSLAYLLKLQALLQLGNIMYPYNSQSTNGKRYI